MVALLETRISVVCDLSYSCVDSADDGKKHVDDGGLRRALAGDEIRGR